MIKGDGTQAQGKPACRVKVSKCMTYGSTFTHFRINENVLSNYIISEQRSLYSEEQIAVCGERPYFFRSDGFKLISNSSQ